MFIQATEDNKGKRDGCYCALVRTVTKDGKYRHEVIRTMGFLPNDRIPYLKAAFNEGDPAEILKKELLKLENKK